VLTTMPTFSGNHQRTSSIQQLLHVLTHIATTIAVWAILWMRRDAHLARFHCESTQSSTKHAITALQFAATVWLRAVEDCHRQTAQHRSPVHMPESATSHTIWRPRDCIPKVKTTSRPYGIMQNTQYSCMHQAEIHLTEATPEPLQDQTQSPVQRPPSSEDTELQHNTHNSEYTKISNYKHYYLLYITRQNQKTHLTGADSRRQPDPSGSTRHVPYGACTSVRNNLRTTLNNDCKATRFHTS
jgi:flagellar biosynthesis regulator FlaF